MLSDTSRQKRAEPGIDEQRRASVGQESVRNGERRNDEHSLRCETTRKIRVCAASPPHMGEPVDSAGESDFDVLDGLDVSHRQHSP